MLLKLRKLHQKMVKVGLNSIASQLAKENKKFIYSALKPGARAKEFEIAIQWLIDAGIIYKISRVKSLQMPLKFYEDLSAFKLFMLDCGLLSCLSEAPMEEILVSDNMFKEYKGAFTEQYVLQQLISRNDCKIYYWSSLTADSELDFLVQKQSKIIPIEVKAEVNVRSKSLKSVIDKNPNLKGLRFSMNDYVNQDWMENYPLYMVLYNW